MPGIALSLAGALAAIATVMYGAWLVVHVALPWLERRTSGPVNPWERAAEARARALFLSKLSGSQRRSWAFRRRFTVTARSGTRFTVAPYDPYNIRTHDALFCLQVGGDTPAYDKLLAQKLLIECDEQFFLAKANVRSYSRRWEKRKEAAWLACYAQGLFTEIPHRRT
jgi:hypothetical protein